MLQRYTASLPRWKLLLINSQILSQLTYISARDVRILQFRMCRILHRIGQHVHNWPSCSELRRRHRNCKNFADFVPQYCS